MQRKLASVQIIDDLAPIPGADRILQARVMGWTVVVKVDEFRVGDPCVFFEVDAILPADAEWAAFMRPRNFRVKTCKLRGVLSQGLALPTRILPEPRDIGDDVTELLGVRKFELPEPQVIDMTGRFPSMIPKTDEIRLQSAMEVLDELRGHPFYIAVKCDGMSSTFARFDGEFIACSRNWQLKPTANVFWTVAQQYDLETILPEGIAVQGEVCGPGIQHNRLKLDGPDLFVFDVFDIRAGKHLDFADFTAFCAEHRLKTVPIDRVVAADDAATFDFSLEHFLELATGHYAGTSNRREGIVVRPLTGLLSRKLRGRLSFKVLNNEFLLEDED